MRHTSEPVTLWLYFTDALPVMVYLLNIYGLQCIFHNKSTSGVAL